MAGLIPLSVPFIRGNESRYVKECLDTAWVSTAGKYVELFEEKICSFTGAKYAIACVNGTSALHVSLRIVGVKTDDEVIIPTVTFIAPVNAVNYLGAHPLFMDCDDYYNIDVKKVQQFLEQETFRANGFTWNKMTKRRISAFVPVHIFGNPVNLEPLMELLRESNIKIVEDASESIGSKYVSGTLNGQHTGNIGDMGCFSFNGNKIITTGGGGMIVTNNPTYAAKATYLTTQAKDDSIYYVHNEVGYNYRMPNVNAAIGLAQLEMLEKFIEAKEKNYHIFKERISDIIGLFIVDVPAYAKVNYWHYALRIDRECYGKGRDGLMDFLHNREIQTRPLWHLNHEQKPYSHCQAYKIEHAPKMLAETLNIPCSVGLTETELERVVAALLND
ncbi:MAG: LegC family aminotransferase [Thiotrichaceae bacterium]